MAAPPAAGSFVQLRGGGGGGGSSSSGVNATVEELRAHFNTQPRFTFEGLIGRGAYGLTCRVVESHPGGSAHRRLAVKRAADAAHHADLRNEMRYLRRLRGAEHIVRIIADRDDARSYVGTRRLRRAFARGAGVGGSLIGLTGPVIVMEYMQNADLARLYYRLVKHKVLLPNRVLWAFFLCLIRACIGLAYPRNAGPDAPTWLETIPTDGTPPSKIEHGDMHLGNVMIGVKGGPFPEHALAPVLKFIDFGMAKEGALGLSENLRKAAMVMMTLITRQATWSRRRVIYQGIDTSAAEILPAPQDNFNTQYPSLDVELRDFLARCLAWQPRDRPSLAAMLRTAEAGARKGASAYGVLQGSRETNQFVAVVLRRLIYDGETEASEARFDEVVFREVNTANVAIQRDDDNAKRAG